MAKQMRVEFSTSEYELSHGKRPSGYGSWAFGLNDPNPDVMSDRVLWAHGTLTEAKAQAKAEAQARYADEDAEAKAYGLVLFVLP